MKMEKEMLDCTEEKTSLLRIILTIPVTILAVVFVVLFLGWSVLTVGVPGGGAGNTGAQLAIMDHYDMFVTNRISEVLDGVLSIKKVYWLNDYDAIAPEPNQACYGTTEDPAEMAPVLEKASELLGIDEFVFHTDVTLCPDSEINWYLDETIFSVSWQEVRNYGVYTFCEVKIAHPSQMRRFLAGNTYGYDRKFFTTQMAADVNAVVASSGDFYIFRNMGIVVQNGQVHRAGGEYLDTCFIDDKGDMIIVKAGELTGMEEVQSFVDEHNIRFSLSFGPAIIQDGQLCVPGWYALGEINEYYPRAALCQVDELHYLLAVVNSSPYYMNLPTVGAFADQLETMGVQTAYNLDGGQTGVIVMNDEMMSLVQYGSQRLISDIFYFATAIPDGG